MPEAMTKERLEELQEMAYDTVGFGAEQYYGEALSEACSEIERLQAALAEARQWAGHYRAKYDEIDDFGRLVAPGPSFLPWEEESKS